MIKIVPPLLNYFVYKFSLILLLNPWIRSGRDTKRQPIKSLFPLGMKLGTELTEVKFLMHIISLHDVHCLVALTATFSDQLRQDTHSLTDNAQNL